VINFKVIPYIDSAITEEPLLKDYRERHLYPSSASVIDIDGNVLGSCARKEFFRLCDIENIDTYKQLFLSDKSQYDQATQEYIFLSGVLWENVVTNLLTKKIPTQHHVKFKNAKFHVSGELDIIVHPPYLPKPIIIEMKTTSGYNNVKKVFKDGIPKIQNVLQCAIYAHHFRKEVMGVKLVYIDRGDLNNRREFDIEYYEKEILHNGKKIKMAHVKINGEPQEKWSINGIYSRFKFIWDSYINMEIPKCDYIPEYTTEILEKAIEEGRLTKTTAQKIKNKNDSLNSDWECHYCKYHQFCKLINNGTIKKDEFKELASEHRKRNYNID